MNDIRDPGAPESPTESPEVETVGDHRRPAFHADRILHAAQEFHMRMVGLPV